MIAALESEAKERQVEAGKAGWSLEQICKLFEVLGIEAKERGTKSESEDYVKALETVLRHKLSESE